MFKKRYLQQSIVQDLSKKMVFVGGPRQVGKTTLAQVIGQKDFQPFQYLNWDDRKSREIIRDETFSADAKLLIFDEIHKYRPWKETIKGIFDTHNNRFRILVTGSARLDLYRKGGDSLLGRYHYYRLHPFSLREIAYREAALPEPMRQLTFSRPSVKTHEILQDLLHFGGFPEPFLQRDERELRRWHNERKVRLVKEDIRDIELVRDLAHLQLLSDLLPERVGLRFSLNALREDIEVNYKTIALWVDILERFYYLFRIYPFAATTIKSLRKEPKMYLWDWSEVENASARLENLVASHLLKFTHALYDVHGYKAQLHYLRDIEGREVDFLVAINNKPWFTVEVKENDTKVSKNLEYFNGRLRIPFSYQVVGNFAEDNIRQNVRIMSVAKFLTGLL